MGVEDALFSPPLESALVNIHGAEYSTRRPSPPNLYRLRAQDFPEALLVRDLGNDSQILFHLRCGGAWVRCSTLHRHLVDRFRRQFPRAIHGLDDDRRPRRRLHRLRVAWLPRPLSNSLITCHRHRPLPAVCFWNCSENRSARHASSPR